MNSNVLVRWLPPNGAIGEIDVFEPHVGGRLRMTLKFDAATGKTSENTDVVDARFSDLEPGKLIGLTVEFVSNDASFAGVMTMTWRLQSIEEGTSVLVVADHVPIGISRAEHEAAMASSLANLAHAVEDMTTLGR